MKGSALADAEPEPEARWIITAATECGLSSIAGMGGVVPVSWSEIRSWQDATGQQGWWLATTIRILSEQYVGEYHAATDPARMSPLQEQMDEQDKRVAVSQQFKAFVRAKK
jgi:hypothetical protein